MVNGARLVVCFVHIVLPPLLSCPVLALRLLKHVRDENWSMMEVVNALCNRRYTEKTVAYAESHDQALVSSRSQEGGGCRRRLGQADCSLCA